MIEMDWFDQLQINYIQAPVGFIGVHAYKKFNGCAYFEVPNEWENEPDFLERIYEISKEEWEKKKKNPTLHAAYCPVCKRRQLGFDFRYHGKKFCRWCGSWYENDGKKITIIRRIDESG